MLICDDLAFGVSVGDSLPPVCGRCPPPVSTPEAFKVRASRKRFRQGRFEWFGHLPEMGGVLEGK
jgi:hypothetical protein